MDSTVVCEILDHDDLAYMVIRWMADRRLDEDLTYLRAASSRIRFLVDRAWCNSHARIIGRGLPCPRLKRSWKGAAQSEKRLLELTGDELRYTADQLPLMLEHAARYGTMLQMRILLNADPSPNPSEMRKAERTMAELGRWGMLEECSPRWRWMNGRGDRDNDDSIFLVSTRYIWKGLGRGGHSMVIRTLFGIHAPVRASVLWVASSAARNGHMDLLGEMCDRMSGTDMRRLFAPLILNGHMKKYEEYKAEFLVRCPDCMDPILDRIMFNSSDAVCKLLLDGRFDAAAALVEVGGYRPWFMTLVIKRNLPAIKWYLRRWSDDVDLYELRESVLWDYPEVVELLAPLVMRNLDPPVDLGRVTNVEPRTRNWIWFVDAWYTTRTREWFMRWAPFWYERFPMDETDAQQFMKIDMTSGLLITDMRELLVDKGKQYAIDWIDEHWTAENKQRVLGQSKWWNQ